MNTYLYTWNPAEWAWEDFGEAEYAVNNEGGYKTRWSCGNRKNIQVGERVVLMRLGVAPKGIVALGYVVSAPYLFEHWNQSKAERGEERLRTDVAFKAISWDPIIGIDALEARFPKNKMWTPESGGVLLPDEAGDWIFSTIESDPLHSFVPPSAKEIPFYTEGAVRHATIKTYDRSPMAKSACIKHYGYSCFVCGFNYFDRYGAVGERYIEVHHLKPVSGFVGEHPVDPIADLRPVCANCHRMLHRKKLVLSIEELASVIKK